jgi:mono/diheme cytochrome c family protein
MLRKLGYGALAVAGILIIASGAVFGITELRMDRKYDDVPVRPLALPADSAAIAYGARLATLRGCVGCHGPDLSGSPVIEDGMIARLYASNLTRGEGGVAAHYDAALFARAIRNGVGWDGRALLFMPAPEFHGMSDEDVGALIAYIEGIPPVDHVQPPSSVGPLGRALFLAGKVDLVPAEHVDHDDVPVASVERGVTVEYGRYLAAACAGCHGAGYSGGKIPGTPPDFIPAANLTPDRESGLGSWTEADLFRALREGRRPDGTELDGRFMPWRETARFTDDEIRAIWLFLQSLPARPEGNR